MVGAGSKDELAEISKKARKLSIPRYIVTDKGLTEIPPGSITALGVGPESSNKVDKVTGNLPLVK